MNDADVAEQLFRSGCACSQAVLAASARRYGLGEEQALRVAAGFAGGMREASTCGAVAGAVMALGLAHGGDACRAEDGRQAAYAVVAAFTRRFRERHASLTCRDLLGCDISTPEGARQAREAGLHRTRCVAFVRDAAELVEDLLPGPPASPARPA